MAVVVTHICPQSTLIIIYNKVYLINLITDVLEERCSVYGGVLTCAAESIVSEGIANVAATSVAPITVLAVMLTCINPH